MSGLRLTAQIGVVGKHVRHGHQSRIRAIGLQARHTDPMPGVCALGRRSPGCNPMALDCTADRRYPA